MVPGLEFVQVPVTDVAHAIQLSLAPVFLLNGVGVLLAMLASRLARVVDRARVMESQLAQTDGDATVATLDAALIVISRRARLINRAITLGTVAALLVSAVVALLFAAAFVTISLGPAIAVVFILSMLSLVGSLCCFLIEVRVSTANLRFGPPRK
jgi:Protein of unknown function (DUF2721)